MALKRKKKEPEAAATPEAERFPLSACSALATHMNHVHGAGPSCSVAFDNETQAPLAGLVATGTEIPGYFLVPARDRWDGQYTGAEIGELLNK